MKCTAPFTHTFPTGFLAGLFLLCSGQLFAQINTWTGSINSNWFSAGNWSNNEVPGASNDVTYIPNVANDPVIGGNGNAFAREVHIAPGGSLIIQAGASLSVDNTAVGLKNEGALNNFGTLHIANPGIAGGNSLENYGSFTNNAGSTIVIDKSASNAIVNNAGSFTNAALIKIGGGSADIHGNGIENHAVFNNNTGGNILIDRTDDDGILNTGAGTFTNQANIAIGGTAAIGQFGIENLAATFHNQSGSIQIDRAATGIYNQLGTFINEAIIEIGLQSSTGNAGIENGASELTSGLSSIAALFNLDITAKFYNTGGSIAIEHFTEGVLNQKNGVFYNNAILNIIGDGQSIPENVFLFVGGIENGGYFNNESGSISIDHVQAGIANYSIFDLSGLFASFPELATFYPDGTPVFINQAEITIGAGVESGEIGILNAAYFENRSGTILIDNVVKFGIANQGAGLFSFANGNAHFINKAGITIGGNTAVGTGIFNIKRFDNQGGSIKIDRTNALITSVFPVYGDGIFTDGDFKNTGTITIGSEADILGSGIQNASPTFDNQNGTIRIDRTGENGFNNYNTVTNSGEIHIGAAGAIGGNGLFSFGLFNNSGELHIDQTEDAGIALGSGLFNNNSTIRMGTLHPIGTDGIHTRGTFQNNAGGEIYIDHAGTVFSIEHPGGNGIHNASGIAFPDISFASASPFPAFDTSVTFVNQGLIHIGDQDGVGLNGILNKGTYTNAGELHIGGGAQIGASGIYHSGAGTFTNEGSGEISIDRVQNYGIFTDIGAGLFTNSGDMTVGADGPVGLEALFNISGFTNASCASFRLFASLNNLGALTNDGLMYFNTGNAHHNTGSFVNNGILNYLQNNPVPNVTNHDLIVAPIGGECGTLPNALEKGNMFSFITGIIWYKNEALTDPAGTYNALANTFTPSSLPEGLHTLYFSVHDNVHSCNRTVAIEVAIDDTTPPTIICPANVTIAALPNCTGFPGSYAPVSISDNCATPEQIQVSQSVSNPFVPFLIGHDDMKTVTLTADDGHGNTQSCNFAVILKDVTPPTVQCKNISIALDGISDVSITQFAVFQSGSDNCGTVIPLSVTPSSFNCASLGINTVQLTATDGHGNNASCTAIVTVTDPLPPTVVCKNASVNLDATGSATVSAGAVFQSGTDNCGTVNPASVSPNTFNCSNLGANNVTLTVNDGHGNNASCTATVTVIDALPPTAICKNATVNLDATGSGTLPAAAVFQSGTDNCGTVNPASVSPNTFNCSNLGANNVTLTVNDGHGNNASCTATVTVIDALPPTVLCKNATVNLDATGSGVLSATNVFQSGTDNCGTVNPASVSPNTFNCSNLGANNVTLTVNDGHGNSASCTATVIVTDAIVPTMICKNLTVNLNGAGTATITPAQVNNGSFDNCTINTLNLSQSVFTCANIGANAITLSGADLSGNKGQCNATVTVVDGIAPTAFCKNATVQLNSAGTVTLAASAVNNGSGDNCSFSLALTPGTFNCANIGTNIVSLKATDASGNTATCTAVVTVQDKTAPTALCKNPVVFLNSLGQATITATDINNGSSDACGIASMTINDNSFNCGDLPGSPIAVQLTVKDVNNNTSTCTAQVTVKDNIAPTPVCQNTTVQLNAQGKATVYGAELAANSVDNCAVWSYSPVAKVYTTANLGVNNLTITVKDWSNNAATCVAQVTVVAFGANGNQNLIHNHQHGLFEESMALSVYPNPADRDVTLEFQLPQDQAVQLRLFDMTGKLVWNKSMDGLKGGNTLPVDLGDLQSGLYLIDLQSGTQREQKRLAIQR